MTEPLVVERGMSYRRYLLLKFHAEMDAQNYELAGTWRALHDDLPGSTPLPVGFPFLALCQERAYGAWEDLFGATVDELTRNLELAPIDAQAVLATWSALPVP